MSTTKPVHPPKFGMPLSHADALAVSDAWWRDVAPGLEKKEKV